MHEWVFGDGSSVVGRSGGSNSHGEVTGWRKSSSWQQKAVGSSTFGGLSAKGKRSAATKAASMTVAMEAC